MRAVSSMASDDELRAKLTRVLISEMRGSAFEASSVPMAAALMPVVRKALADAWDEGAEAAYEWQIGVTGKPENPWRDEP